MANKAQKIRQREEKKIIVDYSLLMARIFSMEESGTCRYQSPRGGGLVGVWAFDKQVGITSLLNVHVVQSTQRQTCSGGKINSQLIPNSGRRTDQVE